MSTSVTPKPSGSADIPLRRTAANDPVLAEKFQRKKSLFFTSAIVAAVLFAALLIFSPTVRALLLKLLQEPLGSQ